MKLPLKQDSIPAILADPETMGLTLSFILESEFEPDVLYGNRDHDHLDPLVVIQHLEHKFRVDLPPALENRIQSVMMLRTTQGFENDVMVFTGIVLSLYDGYLGDLVTGVLEDLNVEEVMWGIFEAACIDPQLGQLSPEVTATIMDVMLEPEDTEVDPDAVGYDALPVADDDMSDVARRMSLLQEQMLRLGVPASVVDVIMERGQTAMTNAAESAQTP